MASTATIQRQERVITNSKIPYIHTADYVYSLMTTDNELWQVVKSAFDRFEKTYILPV